MTDAIFPLKCSDHLKQNNVNCHQQSNNVVWLQNPTYSASQGV